MIDSSAVSVSCCLIDLLDHPADDVAVISGPRKLSYGGLRALALTVAAELSQAGLQRGDRIAVMLPNSINWLAVMFGAAALGVGVVSINVRLGAKEVGETIAATGARAIAYHAEILDGSCRDALESLGDAVLGQIELVLRCGSAMREYRPPAAAIVDLDALIDRPHMVYPKVTGQPTDPCFILATSGTTGQPKRVVHVQERVVRHVRDVARTIGFCESGTVSLATMPFSGAYGFTLLMSALAGGQTVVIADGFDPVESADLLRRHGATHMGGTNDMIYKMLLADPAPRPFPTLQTFIHANFTPSLTEMPPEAERRGVRICGGYGSSEMLAMFTIQSAAAALDERAQAGGYPVGLGAKFRIVDPDSGHRLPDGEIGEIEVFAPNGMIGYLDNPEATSEAMTADGYLRTGDLGYRLPDGRMQFETRRNDVLRIGGYLVAPAEIEDIILGIAGVTACQVVAVRQDLSVRPVAFIIGSANMPTEADIIAACRGRLAKYKVPVRVFRVDDFPQVHGPNGSKVKRNELRDLAMAMMGLG